MLALLLFVNGVVLGILAAVLAFRPDIGANFTNANLQHLFRSAGTSEGAMVAFGATIGAIASLVIGVGLWFLQEWAWWLLLLTTGLPLGRGLIVAAVTLASSPRDFWKAFGTAFWFQTIVYGVIVLYLTRLDIKRLFTARGEYYDAYAPSPLDDPDYKVELKNPAERS
jgi:uncharacterized membrane protein (DUF2068 family)